MGEIRVLNTHGDETIEWDPGDSAQVETARRKFDELKDKGYEFYEVVAAKGARVKKFKKDFGKLIAAPGAQSRSDKATGRRPAAMAGGPNSRVATW